MSSRRPPDCFDPSPSTSPRFMFSSSSALGRVTAAVCREADAATRNTCSAAPLSFNLSSTCRAGRVECSSPGTDKAMMIGRGASRFSKIARRLVDPLQQLPAVRSARPRRQAGQHFGQHLAVHSVVGELQRLPHHRDDRELGATLEPLDESIEGSAEQAGAVVVDDQGDLHQPFRRPDGHHVAGLPTFLDDEVVGREVVDLPAAVVEDVEGNLACVRRR